MGRALEFALATFIVAIINAGFAMWVASVIGNRITELFTRLSEAIGGVL